MRSLDKRKGKGRFGNAGVWAGIVLLIYASFMFWQSLSLGYYTQFGPGPGMFPRWLSGILIVISLLYLWQSARKFVFRAADIFPKGKDLWNMLSVFVSVLMFMLIVNLTGFVIAGTVMMFILLSRGYKWFMALPIALVTSVLLFLLFDKVFSIPLPVNTFGW